MMTTTPAAGVPAASGLRTIVKRALFAVALVLVSPMIAVVRVGALLGMHTLFATCACLGALLPGTFGSACRVAYYFGTLAAITPDVKIGFGSFFSKREARVGRHVRMGAYCILGTVVLEDQVTIASRVSITSGRHQHGSSREGVLEGESSYQPVRIGTGTWIGEGAIVMADVGAGCIVVAGSVVVSPIPDGYVAVGNPARVIRPAAGSASAVAGPGRDVTDVSPDGATAPA